MDGCFLLAFHGLLVSSGNVFKKCVFLHILGKRPRGVSAPVPPFPPCPASCLRPEFWSAHPIVQPPRSAAPQRLSLSLRPDVCRPIFSPRRKLRTGKTQKGGGNSYRKKKNWDKKCCFIKFTSLPISHSLFPG